MANRYARTVGGNWTADATWSTTSGGAADTIAPTASDDVFLDANSGQVTISATSVGKSLDCTGYTGTLTHGNFDLTLSGSITLVSGMTYTPSSASSRLRMNASGTLTTGGKTPWVVVHFTTGTITIGDNLTFINQKTTALEFITLNQNGFSINGNSATNRLLLRSSTLGSSATITNATTSFSNADFRDIRLTSASNLDLSAITGLSGDCGGNSITGGGTVLTFTTAATQTYTGGTDNWSSVAKWTSRVPLPQDDVLMSGVTGGTITADMPRLGKSIDWTGASGSPTWATSGVAWTSYGSLTLISGMTITIDSARTMSFEGRGTHTITSAGRTFPLNFGFVIASVGGSYSLLDAFSYNAQNQFALSYGTFNTNSFSMTGGAFTTNILNSVRAVNLGSSTLTLGKTGTVFEQFTTSLTWNAETSTILISDVSASTKTFAGGGLTYNNLQIAGGGAGAVIITGSNNFARLPQISGGTKTLQITAGTTQTFRSVGVEGFGNGSNVITIQSTSGGSTYTFSRASGIISADYLSLQDSIATGGAEWYAGANSTNVSGNTGWFFTVPQTVSSENLTKAGTSWIWGLDPNSYAYSALLQQEWVPSSGNATIGNDGLLTSQYLQKTYGGLTFFKDYATRSSSVNADFSVGSGTGTWTVTRSATTPATVIDSNGRINIVQHTGPRITAGFYDSTGFVSHPGLIVEGAGTNMALDSYFSQTFATYWRSAGPGGGATVTQDSTYSNPYLGGTIAKAVCVAQNGGIATAAAVKPSAVSGTVYTGSALVRGTGTAKIYFQGTAAQYGSVVTLSSNWIRITGTFTSDLTGQVNIGVVPDDGTSTIYVAYIQLEASPFATTFIPTTTAALTRNAETLTYPISGNRTAASESIFFKYTPFYNPSSLVNYSALTDTDSDRRYISQFHTASGVNNLINTKANAVDDSGDVATATGYAAVLNTSAVIAAVFKHSSPYIEIYANSTSYGTWTTNDFTDNGFGTNFSVGSKNTAGGGGEHLFGIISSIAIFSTAHDATNVAAISNLLAGA